MSHASAFLLTCTSFEFNLRPVSAMMCLSQTTGYAVRALACLENTGSRPCFIRDVAECTGVPKAYLARIISRLARQGIVSAKRGYQGGITLVRPARQVSLLEVVEAVEGKEWIGMCLLGTGCCPKFVCPTQQFWQDIRQRIANKLRQTTLADVIASQPSSDTKSLHCASASRSISTSASRRVLPKATRAARSPSRS